MLGSLKNRSLFAYIMIVSIISASFLLVLFFIKDQQYAGETVNITGKQRMLVQRLALLSNNYFDNPQDVNIYKKTQLSIEELEKNQKYIKALKSDIVHNILYNPVYQYENFLNQYKTNVEKFLSNPTDKHLKIINFTNESLLRTSDILVTLLANQNDHTIKQLKYSVVLLWILFLFVIFMLYRKVTLVAIDEAEMNIQKLGEQKAFMGSILEHSSHAIIATDLNGMITLFNKTAQELLGYTAEEVISKHTPALFHKQNEVVEKAKLLSKEFGVAIEPGFDVFVEKSKRNIKNVDEWTYVTKEGDKFFVKLSITALKDYSGETVGYLGIAEDITTSKYNEAKLEKYVELIDKNIITSSTDLEGIIDYTSEAFCKISGYEKEELIGKNHSMVRHPDMPKKVYTQLWNDITNDRVWSGEIKNLKKDGSFYWVSANIYPSYDIYGKKIGYMAIRQDITDKKLIEKISITDGLTDVFNRRHFDAIFPQMLQINKRVKEYISFLMMDVDHFKQYNDTYGHQMGDSVLIEIAKTLKDSLKRRDDLCFRLGGEEFGAVFFTDDMQQAMEYATEIKDRIEGLKIEHSGNSASKYVTASMGLLCLKHTRDVDEDMIYKEADKLLYEAKKQGRNRIITKEMR